RLRLEHHVAECVGCAWQCKKITACINCGKFLPVAVTGEYGGRSCQQFLEFFEIGSVAHEHQFDVLEGLREASECLGQHVEVFFFRYPAHIQNLGTISCTKLFFEEVDITLGGVKSYRVDSPGKQADLFLIYSLSDQFALGTCGRNENQIQLIVKPGRIFPDQFFDCVVSGQDVSILWNGGVVGPAYRNFHYLRDGQPGKTQRPWCGHVNLSETLLVAIIEYLQQRGQEHLLFGILRKAVNSDRVEIHLPLHRGASFSVTGNHG